MSKKIKQLPIFVYGTLMKGHPNHNRIFGNRDVQYVDAHMDGVCLVKPSRRAPFPYMVNTAAIPKQHRPGGEGVVRGQLLTLDFGKYEDWIKQLDELEGVPDHYERREVVAWVDQFQGVECYVYSLPDELVPYLFFDPVIRHGDWSAEVRDQRLYTIAPFTSK